MKCDICQCDTYIINVNRYRGRICEGCHKMGDLTKNFSRAEFACKCGCGLDDVDHLFVERLQRIRDRSGVPMVISSGCRCARHNRDEDGSATSDHLTGEGADIRVSGSRERYKLMAAAFAEKIPRIGGPTKTFVHLGMNADNDEDVLWLY